ncbi:hypothetical protein AUK40_04060 [Candidatus Wirthbacteria bacterium CG2_30_54_11]|uniref:Glycosyltransferase subfamily 4-like N-terminal domain-containing protein n=1 Tax=Candidatus Wirthbacteria bacterium CG2_30_54_11 TaxID=1817892 RepID=A0A1J5IK54_9BACT|nr:MAG: hypothetical protein AUK40_04060 [Candidatus Wirthbacteria bacterium CG2_30_54_11]
MKQSILMVVDNYFPRLGGAELVYQRLAEGLVSTGHEVEVVTTGVQGSPRSETINGVAVKRLCQNRYLFLFQAFFFLLFRKSEATIVQTATYAAALPAWLYARLTKKRVVITVHEVLGKGWFHGMNAVQGRIHFLLERFVLLLPFDRYIAVSDYTARSLTAAGISKDKVAVVLNGVDEVSVPALQRDTVLAGHGFDPGSFVFLYFGRLGISKGLDLLVAAARELLPVHPTMQLGLVVAEKAHDHLFQLLVDLQLDFPRQVRLMASLPRGELLTLVASSDCIVVPSRTEGFGLSAIEACMLGKPLVSSDGGALADHVYGQVNLFASGDRADLKQAMEKALMGKFEHIEKKLSFSWDEMVEGYEEVYG